MSDKRGKKRQKIQAEPGLLRFIWRALGYGGGAAADDSDDDESADGFESTAGATRNSFPRRGLLLSAERLPLIMNGPDAMNSYGARGPPPNASAAAAAAATTTTTEANADSLSAAVSRLSMTQSTNVSAVVKSTPRRLARPSSLAAFGHLNYRLALAGRTAKAQNANTASPERRASYFLTCGLLDIEPKKETSLRCQPLPSCRPAPLPPLPPPVQEVRPLARRAPRSILGTNFDTGEPIYVGEMSHIEYRRRHIPQSITTTTVYPSGIIGMETILKRPRGVYEAQGRLSRPWTPEPPRSSDNNADVRRNDFSEANTDDDEYGTERLLPRFHMPEPHRSSNDTGDGGGNEVAETSGEDDDDRISSLGERLSRLPGLAEAKLSSDHNADGRRNDVLEADTGDDEDGEYGTERQLPRFQMPEPRRSSNDTGDGRGNEVVETNGADDDDRGNELGEVLSVAGLPEADPSLNDIVDAGLEDDDDDGNFELGIHLADRLHGRYVGADLFANPEDFVQDPFLGRDFIDPPDGIESCAFALPEMDPPEMAEGTQVSEDHDNAIPIQDRELVEREMDEINQEFERRALRRVHFSTDEEEEERSEAQRANIGRFTGRSLWDDLKPKNGAWKCSSCFLLCNDPDASKCASCEALRWNCPRCSIWNSANATKCQNGTCKSPKPDDSRMADIPGASVSITATTAAAVTAPSFSGASFFGSATIVAGNNGHFTFGSTLAATGYPSGGNVETISEATATTSVSGFRFPLVKTTSNETSDPARAESNSVTNESAPTLVSGPTYGQDPPQGAAFSALGQAPSASNATKTTEGLHDGAFSTAADLSATNGSAFRSTGQFDKAGHGGAASTRSRPGLNASAPANEFPSHAAIAPGNLSAVADGSLAVHLPATQGQVMAAFRGSQPDQPRLDAALSTNEFHADAHQAANMPAAESGATTPNRNVPDVAALGPDLMQRTGVSAQMVQSFRRDTNNVDSARASPLSSISPAVSGNNARYEANAATLTVGSFDGSGMPAFAGQLPNLWGLATRTAGSSNGFLFGNAPPASHVASGAKSSTPAAAYQSSFQPFSRAAVTKTKFGALAPVPEAYDSDQEMSFEDETKEGNKKPAAFNIQNGSSTTWQAAPAPFVAGFGDSTTSAFVASPTISSIARTQTAFTPTVNSSNMTTFGQSFGPGTHSAGSNPVQGWGGTTGVSGAGNTNSFALVGQTNQTIAGASFASQPHAFQSPGSSVAAAQNTAPAPAAGQFSMPGTSPSLGSLSAVPAAFSANSAYELPTFDPIRSNVSVAMDWESFDNTEPGPVIDSGTFGFVPAAGEPTMGNASGIEYGASAAYGAHSLPGANVASSYQPALNASSGATLFGSNLASGTAGPYPLTPASSTYTAFGTHPGPVNGASLNQPLMNSSGFSVASPISGAPPALAPSFNPNTPTISNAQQNPAAMPFGVNPSECLFSIGIAPAKARGNRRSKPFKTIRS